MLSYEICEFFKNTYFEEHLGATAFIKSFISNAPFLYPLKTLENPTVFWCFQAIEKGYIRNKWVKVFYYYLDMEKGILDNWNK